MTENTLPKIVPLGDQAALVYLESEPEAARFAASVRAAAPLWLVDVVQAYSSVAVFFEPNRSRFLAVAGELATLATAPPKETPLDSRTRYVLPCCYEMALDLERIAQYTHRTAEEIIRLHTSQEYTVYAIGFCPGFPYLGYLPPGLAGVPRLSSPRLRVEAGSVGLTGRQTGIYTLPRPGGWNLLGRTPLQLVDVADEYFPLRTGDRICFRRVDEAEFRHLEGERLEVKMVDNVLTDC